MMLKSSTYRHNKHFRNSNTNEANFGLNLSRVRQIILTNNSSKVDSVNPESTSMFMKRFKHTLIVKRQSVENADSCAYKRMELFMSPLHTGRAKKSKFKYRFNFNF